MNTPSRFPWPNDQLAWSNYLLSLIGAWILCLGLAAPPPAIALAASSLGAFLCSDWLSLWMGRTRDGAVRPSKTLAWQGIALLVLVAAGLTALLKNVPLADRNAWAQILGSVACALVLVYVLRLEWVALDARLVFLTHLLLSSPALLIAFLHWGPLQMQAFQLWVLPATFFASQALFNVLWFKSQAEHGHAPSVLALPLLSGAIALLSWGHWLHAAFLVLFLIRCLTLLRQRGAESLPAFQAIRDLSLELHVWSGATLLIWLLT